MVPAEQVRPAKPVREEVRDSRPALPAAVRKPRVQQAGFVVLTSPDIPNELVETAYISNAADERMLTVADRRERLADAIFQGVQGYFEDHPPEGTQFAATRRSRAPAAQAAAGSVTLR